MENQSPPDAIVGIIDATTCDRCGTQDNVEFLADPFALEIYGETDMTWLCPICIQESYDDI